MGQFGRISVLLLCLGAALFARLARGSAPRSRCEWVHYPLIALVALTSGWPALRLDRRKAALVPLWQYLVAVLLLGLAVELTLTVDGSGIGGMHPDTGTSMVLALGDYTLLAAALWS